MVSNISKLWIDEQRQKVCNLCKKKKLNEDLSPLFPPYITTPLDPCAVTIAAPRRQHPRQRPRGLVPWPIPCTGISRTSAKRYRPQTTWPRIVPCESGPRWPWPGTCHRPRRTRRSWPGRRSGSPASSADVLGRTCRGSSSTLHLRAVRRTWTPCTRGGKHRLRLPCYLVTDITIRLSFR